MSKLYLVASHGNNCLDDLIAMTTKTDSWNCRSAAYVNIVHQMKSHSIIPTALEIDPEHAEKEWEQRKEEMKHAMGFLICYNSDVPSSFSSLPSLLTSLIHHKQHDRFAFVLCQVTKRQDGVISTTMKQKGIELAALYGIPFCTITLGSECDTYMQQIQSSHDSTSTSITSTTRQQVATSDWQQLESALRCVVEKHEAIARIEYGIKKRRRKMRLDEESNVDGSEKHIEDEQQPGSPTHATFKTSTSSTSSSTTHHTSQHRTLKLAQAHDPHPIPFDICGIPFRIWALILFGIVLWLLLYRFRSGNVTHTIDKRFSRY